MQDNDTAAFENSEILWARPLRFWLLLISDILAITCSLFVLYHLLFDRTQRRGLHNHTIIVIITLALISQLIDIPWYLDFIRKGIVWPQTPAHCQVWWLIDLGFYNTIAIILAWSSIERHILIFHNRWVLTKKKCFYVHYLPLITLLLYATIYYATLIFFPPCQHQYMYILPVCSATPCHLFHPIIGLWEMGVHGCLCTMIIACFSIALLIRVIMHRRLVNRAYQWRKYRKMIVQLLFISAVYLLINLPIMILLVARQCGLPANVAVEEQLVAFFITYWTVFLLPVVSLISLPGLKKRISKLAYMWRQHPTIVHPMRANVIGIAGIRQQYETYAMR